MTNKEIYTDKLTRGKRTYFFDINESDQGDFYLKVSESKKTDHGYEHYRIMIFEEDIKEFSDAIIKALRKFKQIKIPNNKTYSVEEIRKKYSQAYLPWTIVDDKRLELLYCEGKKLKELEEFFNRNQGAISSRIKKLELKEKYGLKN